MEQHPIPQNVSSYQFKLVGDMTLKQFFQVAGGVLVGIIFYSSPLLPVIKWPLAFIAVLLGVGLAFLPLEERPLEKWIFAFFRAIYAPTIFTWRKSSAPYKFFQDEAPETTTAAVGGQQDVAVKTYLATTTQVPQSTSNLDQAESGFLSRLTGIFSGAPVPAAPAVQNTTIGVVHPQRTPVGQVIPNVQPPPPPFTQTEDVKEIQIPQTSPVKIEPSTGRMVIEEKPAVANPGQLTSSQISPVIAGNEMISTKKAMFSVDAAPPNPPTYPNVVVGQVVDQDRKIVEGAIMEIRDSAGRPIRALRSNKVGHFITVTQLDNGHYEIITEKEGYEFEPVSFDAVGTLIPPILVQGTRLGPLVETPSVPVKPFYSIN